LRIQEEAAVEVAAVLQKYESGKFGPVKTGKCLGRLEIAYGQWRVKNLLLVRDLTAITIKRSKAAVLRVGSISGATPHFHLALDHFLSDDKQPVRTAFHRASLEVIDERPKSDKLSTPADRIRQLSPAVVAAMTARDFPGSGRFRETIPITDPYAARSGVTV
jgi:hypothetical protein